MTEETLSEKILIRITPSTRRALEEVALSNRYTNDVSKHVRLAIEEYVIREGARTIQQETIDA